MADILIHDALDSFLYEKYDETLDPKTYAFNKAVVEALKWKIPARWTLQGMTDADLNHLIVERRREKNHVGKPVSAATVNRTLTLFLSRVFSHFERTRGLTFPLKPKFNAHILKEPRPRDRSISHDEYTKLAAGDPDYMAVVRFALLTGNRRANLLPTWDQVNLAADLKSGTVTVEIKSEGFAKEKVAVELPEAAVRLIHDQRGLHPTHVFTYVATDTRMGHVAGKRYPITTNGLRIWWNRNRQKAGVKNLRIHDLRHSAATALLETTGDLTLVQKQLGHRDIKSTMRYAHARRAKLIRGLNDTASASPWGRS